MPGWEALPLAISHVSMSKPELDALLRHSRWVRAVAASLSRDPGLAEDAVQETWLAVLKRGPRDQRSLRAWLATLVRRHLRQARRGSERRSRREERHARPLALPSTAELVVRAESDRDLVQAVLDLREPFRSTVLLRWFEELTPDEIAERAGVPVSTVYSRLARGHAALRARFERGERERRGEAGALVALGLRERWSALRSRATVWARFLQPAVGFAVLAVAGWLLVRVDGSPAREVPLVARADAPDREEHPTLLAAPPAEREAVVMVEADASARVTRSGRVLDSAGKPASGVEIVLAESESADAPVLQHLVSAADGSFAFRPPAAPGVLLARDAAWETVLVSLVDPARSSEPVVVVAPKVAVAGHVLGPDHEPLAGAIVELFVFPDLPVAYERALDAARPKRPWSRTGDDGAFEFAGLPFLRQAHLSVRHPAFGNTLVPVPSESRAALEVVLSPPAFPYPTVRGVVRDARGVPVEGAEVAAFPSATRSDASGRFELVLRPPYLQPVIAAMKSGVGATALEFERRGDGVTRWPEQEIELALPEHCAELRGRVVDDRGRLAAAAVWIADPTFVRATPRGALAAENLAVDPESPVWRPVATRSGSFRIEGLLAREYELCALDPTTLEATSQTVRPDELAELVLPRRAERLAGCVVDASGKGVPGVSVRLAREVFRALPAVQMEALEVFGPSGCTDAGGRFELSACATDSTLLRLSSDAILPTTFEVATLEDRADLRLVVPLRAHLRVELIGAADSADAFEALDEDGNPLELVQLREACSHPSSHPRIVEGRSLVLAAPDGVREVVLYQAGREVGRTPVTLEPGQLTVVRW